MPKVSIIIRSYNEERHIGRLLHGIREQNFCDFETIVVDSGSTDKTVAIAESYGATIVHIPKAEFSFGRALNLGCSAAKGELLVFASAHVYPLRKDWIEKLIQPFKDPTVGVSYGRQMGNDLTKFSEHQVFRSWFPAVAVQRQKTYFCNNANCGIRQRDWLKQPYNEVLTGLEDLDWAKKAQADGKQISYVAEAAVVHVHQETWSRIRHRYQREAMALLQIEPRMGFTSLDFVSLTLRSIASDWRSAVKQSTFSSVWVEVVVFRLNQFLGTWLGHHNPAVINSELRSRFYYPMETSLPTFITSDLEIDYSAESTLQSKNMDEVAFLRIGR